MARLWDSYLGYGDSKSGSAVTGVGRYGSSDRGNELQVGESLVLPEEISSSYSDGIRDTASSQGLSNARLAGDVFGLRGSLIAAKTQADAAVEAAKIQRKQASKNRTTGILGSALSAGVKILGGFAACDGRFKRDVAPLQHCDIDDRLSRLAFAVQMLRDHA